MLTQQSLSPPVQLCPIHAATYWFCIQTEFRPSRAFPLFSSSLLATLLPHLLVFFCGLLLLAKVCTFIQWILNRVVYQWYMVANHRNQRDTVSCQPGWWVSGLDRVSIHWSTHLRKPFHWPLWKCGTGVIRLCAAHRWGHNHKSHRYGPTSIRLA